MSSPDETKDMQSFSYSQLYSEIEPVFKTLCDKVGIRNKIVLQISRDTKKLGHFTVHPIYGPCHEISISGNYFHRGGKGVLTTLLHECVHAINSENGVKDASGPKNEVHNKDFRKEAEKVGLFYKGPRSMEHGYSMVKFTDESIERWRPELDIITKILDNLDIKEIKEETKKPKKKTKRIYVCLECDTLIQIAFIKKDVLNLIRCRCGGYIMEDFIQVIIEV